MWVGGFDIGEGTHSMRLNIISRVGGEAGNTISNLVALELRVCFDRNAVNDKFPWLKCRMQGL
jgi:hypothetical protein